MTTTVWLGLILARTKRVRLIEFYFNRRFCSSVPLTFSNYNISMKFEIWWILRCISPADMGLPHSIVLNHARWFIAQPVLTTPRGFQSIYIIRIEMTAKQINYKWNTDRFFIDFFWRNVWRFYSQRISCNDYKTFYILTTSFF